MLKTPKLFSTDNITGCSVTNNTGEDLGKIEDLVVDAEQGCIGFAVLSFGGGFLGMGERFFPIPWQALHPSPEGDTFILDLDREVIKNAPSFDKPDKNRWSMADYEYLARVYRYYDYPPYWENLETVQTMPGAQAQRSTSTDHSLQEPQDRADPSDLHLKEREQEYENRAGSRAYRPEGDEPGSLV